MNGPGLIASSTCSRQIQLGGCLKICQSHILLSGPAEGKAPHPDKKMRTWQIFRQPAMDLTRTCGPGNLSWPIHGSVVPSYNFEHFFKIWHHFFDMCFIDEMAFQRLSKSSAFLISSFAYCDRSRQWARIYSFMYSTQVRRPR